MEWLFGKYDDGVAALGLSEDPPMVAPAGSYQVRVRVVEAKDLVVQEHHELVVEEPGGG